MAIGVIYVVRPKNGLGLQRSNLWSFETNCSHTRSRRWAYLVTNMCMRSCVLWIMLRSNTEYSPSSISTLLPINPAHLNSVFKTQMILIDSRTVRSEKTLREKNTISILATILFKNGRYERVNLALNRTRKERPG